MAKKSLQKQLDEARQRVQELEQQLAAQRQSSPRPSGTGCGTATSSRQPAMH